MSCLRTRLFAGACLLAVAVWPAALGQKKEIMDCLEKGDAANALESARKAAAVEAAGSEVLRIAAVAAIAAGDAQLADECFRKLAEKSDGAEKTAISRNRQYLISVGKEAPAVTIDCADGSSFNVTKRGDKVLIIDFWNVLAPPSKEPVAALKKLYNEHKENPNIEFVGVSADLETRRDKAEGFAKSSGFDWPLFYEKAVKPPITNEAFRAGNPPWTVLVDSYGNIRAIGSADDAAFRFAVRAAVAEARGDFEPIMPRMRDGQQAAKPGSRGELAKAGEKAVADKKAADEKEAARKNEAARNPPSDPEARKLLIEAHAMRRTGIKTKARELYQKIVKEFPGTKEAQEAQENLE